VLTILFLDYASIYLNTCFIVKYMYMNKLVIGTILYPNSPPLSSQCLYKACRLCCHGDLLFQWCCCSTRPGVARTPTTCTQTCWSVSMTTPSSWRQNARRCARIWRQEELFWRRRYLVKSRMRLQQYLR